MHLSLVDGSRGDKIREGLTFNRCSLRAAPKPSPIPRPNSNLPLKCVKSEGDHKGLLCLVKDLFLLDRGGCIPLDLSVSVRISYTAAILVASAPSPPQRPPSERDRATSIPLVPDSSAPPARARASPTLNVNCEGAFRATRALAPRSTWLAGHHPGTCYSTRLSSVVYTRCNLRTLCPDHHRFFRLRDRVRI